MKSSTRKAAGKTSGSSRSTKDSSPAWDTRVCEQLIAELWALRSAMVEHAAGLQPWLAELHPAHQLSAINLAHFLALRHGDLRRLQAQLAWLGLSSLGRAETHVLANVDKVLGILHRLCGREWQSLTGEEPVGSVRGPAQLAANARALLGPAPRHRSVRIMVTLPAQAASSDSLIEGLIAQGMDIARINCAHDSPADWAAMAQRVREAAARAGRSVRIHMDLAGPKLRTGAFAEEAAVIKLKPERDLYGRVSSPARLGLQPLGGAQRVAGAQFSVSVPPDWLKALRVGDRIELRDARDADRRLNVVELQPGGALVECTHSAYLVNQTRLHLQRATPGLQDATLSELPAAPGQLQLHRGEIIHLLGQGLGRAARPAGKNRRSQPAVVVCTLPQALGALRKGERVFFDDGRIGAVVRRRVSGGVALEITQARDGGERLAADKGINMPDTALDLPALSEKDLADLELVARHADIVGLSFAQSAADVRALRARLLALGAGHLGLILKIETQRGFEHLPEMLLAAMACPHAGVMIARGDLAVECGYERMAEVQEEILWACEAAHMPVVWATQVLESLAKTGLPSRAEITDAAMGERAECVMLNKGPHILDAMRTLDNILQRMQAHQSKKRPLLRALKSWSQALALGAEGAA